jgi:hypothetical protein
VQSVRMSFNRRFGVKTSGYHTFAGRAEIDDRK